MTNHGYIVKSRSDGALQLETREDFSSQLHRAVRKAKHGVHSDASSEGHSPCVLSLLPAVLLISCAGERLRERGNGSWEISQRSKHTTGEVEPSVLPQDQWGLFQPGCSFSWMF